MWNDAGQESGKRSDPFKLIVGRGLVGVRGQQQTPINKFPENLPTRPRAVQRGWGLVARVCGVPFTCEAGVKRPPLEGVAFLS